MNVILQVLEPYVSNIASVFKELALPIQDVFRTTKKENTEHHRSIGNLEFKDQVKSLDMIQLILLELLEETP